MCDESFLHKNWLNVKIQVSPKLLNYLIQGKVIALANLQNNHLLKKGTLQNKWQQQNMLLSKLEFFLLLCNFSVENCLFSGSPFALIITVTANSILYLCCQQSTGIPASSFFFAISCVHNIVVNVTEKVTNEKAELTILLQHHAHKCQYNIVSKYRKVIPQLSFYHFSKASELF